MTSLEQLVQEWLDMDKVRICFADKDIVLLHYMCSRKRQGPRYNGYGNQEITGSSRAGSGMYLPDHLLLSGGEILFKGRESNLGLQVRLILGLSAGVVANREHRPSGKNGSGVLAYE